MRAIVYWFLVLGSWFLVAVRLNAQVPVRWIVETSRPFSHIEPAFQGETLIFEPTILNYGVPVSWPADTAVRLYWQTNGMGQTWWSLPGSTGTVAGRLTATWSPTNDIGATRYTFFLAGGSASSGTSYRAHGTIRLSASPGFAPAAAPPPTYYPTLASALVPYVVPLLPASDPAGSAQGVSNALAGALQAEADDRASGDAASLAALATNRVTRLSGSNCWQAVEGGTSYVYTVTADTNRVRIVSVSPDFNGPAVGTVFGPMSSEPGGLLTGGISFPNAGLGFGVDIDTGVGLYSSDLSAVWVGTGTLPTSLAVYYPEASGSCVLDYGTATNREAQASQATVIIIADKVQANTDAIAAIPLPPTNAIDGWLVWDGGSNRYWRVSATNLRFYVWGDI